MCIFTNVNNGKFENLVGMYTGINRGVFGVTSSKKREIEGLVMKLEAKNPTPNPTQCLDKVDWKFWVKTSSYFAW